MRRLLAVVMFVVPTLATAQFTWPTPFKVSAESSQNRTAALKYTGVSSGAGFDCTGAASCVSFDGRHNLVTYSQVTRLALNAPPVGVSDAPNQLSATLFPGSSVKVVNDGGTNTAYKAATLTLGQYYIGSFYVRMEDGGAPVIGSNTDAGDFAIVIDGNLSSNSASFISTPVGGGVYRVSAQRQATAGGARFFGVVKYATQSNRAFYLDGFQANIAKSSTDYTPTAFTPTGASILTSVPLDSAGMSWSVAGSPTAIPATALPTTASAGAAGPFSDTNFYSYGTGSDPLDSTGDRFGCVAFVPSTADLAGGKSLVANGASGVAGYWVEINASPTFVFRSNTPALVSAISATPVVANGLNVGCWWRSATSISSKANLGATITNVAAGTEVAGTAYPALIGRNSAVGRSATGTILAVVQGLGACPTPPAPFAASCEGWSTYQMSRQFGMIGTKGELLSVSRTTSNGFATYGLNGRTWSAVNGVPRVTSDGMLVERASANSALQSSNTCSAGSVVGPWINPDTMACVADAAVAPDGTATMDQWIGTSTGNYIYQSAPIASTATATASVWASKVTGTGQSTVGIQCASGTVSSCTCAVSDKSACNVLIASPNCWGRATAVGTSPVRIQTKAVCAAATTSWLILLSPGGYSATTETSNFGGAQIEPGASATSVCLSGSSACARGQETPSIPWPSLPDINRWCVKATITPFAGRSWDYTYGEVWSAGQAATVNSARMLFTSGVLSFRVYDSAGALKLVQWTPSYTAGSTHTIKACNANGSLYIYSDGAWVSGGASGAGAGVWTSAPATLYIENMNTSVSGADAHAKDVAVCKGSNAVQCR